MINQHILISAPIFIVPIVAAELMVSFLINLFVHLN